MHTKNIISLQTINTFYNQTNTNQLDTHQIKKIKKINQTLPTSISKHAFVRYEFRFVSLLPPHIPSFINSHTWSSTNINANTARRHFLKKSYLLLSWFHYVTSNRRYTSSTRIKVPEVLKIAILPSKRSMYTLTKAPMAHKTFSKEQYMFKFYNFKFSISLIPYEKLTITSAQHGAFLMEFSDTNFPYFETNLLFLKYYKVNYPVTDFFFFTNILNNCKN